MNEPLWTEEDTPAVSVNPQMNLFWSTENLKAHKTKAVYFNLPAKTTCPGAGSCLLYCYARYGQLSMGSSKSNAERNYEVTKGPDFVRLVTEDLRRITTRGINFPTLRTKPPVKGHGTIVPIAVRLHAAGDFYSQAYIDKWFQVMRQFPRMRFYAYTKSHHLSFKGAPANFHLVRSHGGRFDDRIPKGSCVAAVYDGKKRKPAGWAYGGGLDLPALHKPLPRVIGLPVHGGGANRWREFDAMVKKERSEHPTLPMKTITQVALDHMKEKYPQKFRGSQGNPMGQTPDEILCDSAEFFAVVNKNLWLLKFLKSLEHPKYPGATTKKNLGEAFRKVLKEIVARYSKALSPESRTAMNSSRHEHRAPSPALTPRIICFMRQVHRHSKAIPGKDLRVWRGALLFDLHPTMMTGRPTVHLRTIQSIEPGWGVAFMGWLTALADKHRVSLDLTAQGWGNKPIDKDKLIKFYRAFDFKTQRGYPSYSGYMVRMRNPSHLKKFLAELASLKKELMRLESSPRTAMGYKRDYIGDKYFALHRKVTAIQEKLYRDAKMRNPSPKCAVCGHEKKWHRGGRCQFKKLSRRGILRGMEICGIGPHRFAPLLSVFAPSPWGQYPKGSMGVREVMLRGEMRRRQGNAEMTSRQEKLYRRAKMRNPGRKWMGEKPTACQVCGQPFTEFFRDAPVKGGHTWGLLCAGCSQPGVGQTYRMDTMEKVEPASSMKATLGKYKSTGHFRMTAEEYNNLTKLDQGLCIKCASPCIGVEPDARKRKCMFCGDKTVYGAEELLMMGRIHITNPCGGRHRNADETEGIRREMVRDINIKPGSRKALEKQYGKVWDTDQVRAEFDVIGFMAPFVVVKRKSDGAKGSLMFQHDPRFYFSFTLDNPRRSRNPGRSMCKCGHTGDGVGSQHEDTFGAGHGPCKLCSCRQFTWTGFIKGREKMKRESDADMSKRLNARLRQWEQLGLRKMGPSRNRNWGDCPVCGGPGWGAGEICMDCVKSRHRGAVTHKCSCGRKRKPVKMSSGSRRWLSCERCLAPIRQLNPVTSKEKCVGVVFGEGGSFRCKAPIVAYVTWNESPFWGKVPVCRHHLRSVKAYPGFKLLGMVRKNPLTRKETFSVISGSRSAWSQARREQDDRKKAYLMGASIRGMAIAADHTRTPEMKRSAVSFIEGVARGDIRLGNPPRIGRTVIKIETDVEHIKLLRSSPLYAVKGGSIFIKGPFTRAPKGRCLAVEYKDEAKAKRCGQNPRLPWRHDFSHEKAYFKKVRGGIMLCAADRPLWGRR